MDSPISSDRPSWFVRALLGAIVGGFTGLLQLLSDFSRVSLGSAVVAGALFGAIIGVLAVHLAKTRRTATLLGASAGAVAGFGWATMRSSDAAGAVIAGVLLGGLVAFVEFPSNGPVR